MMKRRAWLTASVAGAAGLAFGVWNGRSSCAASGEPQRAGPEPFRDWLRQQARARAASAYRAPQEALPKALQDLNYDRYRDIRFRPDHSLWRKEKLPFELQFFHLGMFYRTPVRINVLDSKGVATPVTFAPASFDYGANRFDKPLPRDLGFAGFRIHYALNRPDYLDELAVFLGATYFRSVGRHNGYGLSARGLALDVAASSGEEFPAFREFWIEKPAPGARQLTVHALLDSPSVTGAYSFVVHPGTTTIWDVTVSLFPRVGGKQWGIAPLTSMYLFGENDRLGVDDFRPEVHDSDGLAIWTGDDERIWRPLVNPGKLRVSLFECTDPRGFGLLQRDRSNTSYMDLEARYERRPSAWVEPVGGWGKGKVMLVEIPADQEIHDNMVAVWRPDQFAGPGQEHQLAYRLHWGAQVSPASGFAMVVNTMVGAGSEPNSRRFVLDFKAPQDRTPPADAELVVRTSAGRIRNATVHPNPDIQGWRAFFELDPEGDEPIELVAYLQAASERLSETWAYQWTA